MLLRHVFHQPSEGPKAVFVPKYSIYLSQPIQHGYKSCFNISDKTFILFRWFMLTLKIPYGFNFSTNGKDEAEE